MTDRTPAETLRAWAKAYREGPKEYRFTSDPDAEFFPADMERAAEEIEQLYRMRDGLVEVLRAVNPYRTVPRPTSCGNPMKCGWHKVRTEPDINYWSCNQYGCPNMPSMG